MALNHENYRIYIKELLEQRPRKGRGELQKIAEHLRIHTTLISQIMSGSRELTEEQAFDLADYLQLSETETEYLLLLVQIERASTQKFKKHLLLKLKNFKIETQKVSKQFTKENELTETEKSVFYSSWIYSAIRLYCSTHPNGKTVQDIVEHFQISRIKALQYLNFLVSTSLCEMKNEFYIMGQQRTYIDRGSIYFLKHHLNWRMKSIEKSEIAAEDEKLYTVTMSISENDFVIIKDKISKLLNDVIKITKETNPEKVVCLACDFFKVGN
jgi:uncharacterized protein (TIGR02147 family)